MSKKTPLNKWHVLKGAQMGVFGGYEMPLWYPIPVTIVEDVRPDRTARRPIAAMM